MPREVVPYDPSKYDPVARRERYLRSRGPLKGRSKGVQRYPTGRPPAQGAQTGKNKVAAKPKVIKPLASKDSPAEAKARISRLKGKISQLEGALTKALTALAEKRRNSDKEEKKNSDGKTTAKERQSAKEYRDKNKAEIAAKDKAENKKKSAAGSSSKSSSSESSDGDSIADLEARVSKIKGAIALAKKQLSAAQSASGSLAHSSDTAEVQLRLNFPTEERKSVKMKSADFGGYATRHGVECADGRTILPSAFQGNDGDIVPLVFQHGHNDINNVLGHVKLEHREEGVYCHAFFNETAQGQNAKMQVEHGDLKYLSIFANNLVEKSKAGLAHAKDVFKGNIREVSLVLAGANPGAYIDNIAFAHGDGEYGIDTSEAVIKFVDDGLSLELSHADTKDDEDEETLQDVLDTLNEKQMTTVQFLLSQALTHSDMDEDEDEDEDDSDDDSDDSDAEADADADTETDAEADADADHDTDADAAQHDNIQEDNSMSHNVFDQSRGSADARPQVTLSHDALEGIVAQAKKNGSLKDAVANYVATTGVSVNGQLQHGIENIEYLFPDAQLLESSPAFVSRRMEWVDKVLSSVRKSPFSRIKTITADITPDEARARGYIKGNMKNEEFFALSKRETTPQTIYKKQKLDRDDVIDITSLDVVAWLKAEMKVMLDEEIAGAVLVGDGRSIGDEDKILETKIRPIATDAELYVTTVNVNLGDTGSSVEELVDAVIENRRYYKGSGQPSFFTTEATISAFLTVKDNFGRRLYASLSEVAAVLRVAEIVPVEIMERDESLVGIMVNLADYTLGADRGGQATMFDDFDIDYNKLRYLIETRLSGALTQPKAALVFRRSADTSVLVVPGEPTIAANVVTVPTTAGVTYKNAASGATLTTANPVTLSNGQTLKVVAVPESGKHFGNNAEDEWTFKHKA